VVVNVAASNPEIYRDYRAAVETSCPGAMQKAARGNGNACS
jgi:hypothetical protein